MQFLSKVIWAS